MWFQRRAKRIKWTEKIRNETVLKRIGGEEMRLRKMLKKRNKLWVEHEEEEEVK